MGFVGFGVGHFFDDGLGEVHCVVLRGVFAMGYIDSALGLKGHDDRINIRMHLHWDWVVDFDLINLLRRKSRSLSS